ncbi:hypothetical protein SDC9_139770 [bioreactor metagenome]|uniref:Uncharacterized protein n=1 Tax=bioreactor metagenome TaxID=1076179 RepID=A0A645DTN2_9ZZZZ
MKAVGLFCAAGDLEEIDEIRNIVVISYQGGGTLVFGGDGINTRSTDAYQVDKIV